MRRSDYPDPILADNIQRIILDNKLTHSDMAEVVDRDRKTIGAWARCETSPSAIELKRLCLKYKVSADDMLGLTDKDHEFILRDDNEVVLKTNDTLCWRCKNAYCGCSWSRDLIPVLGWEAELYNYKDGAKTNASYCVKKCPLFIEG